MHDESISRRPLEKERVRRYYLENREKFLERAKRRHEEQRAARGQIATECACGCGETPKIGNRFMHGHNHPLFDQPRCPCCEGLPSSWRTNRCTDAFHNENRAGRKSMKARYYQATAEQAAERGRQRYAENPEFRERTLIRTRAWFASQPDRFRIAIWAAGRVKTALRRGVLTRPDTCEQCGATDVAIQAAHHDYSRPLKVRWLCRPCHSRWDHQQPKTLPS